MIFEQAPEFAKELKRLAEKWRSLPSDIRDAQMTIADVYGDGEQHELFTKKFFDGKRATKLRVLEDGGEVVKMHLDVAALGVRDKARVVCIAVKQQDNITFIELYTQNEKDSEDKERFKKYLEPIS